MSSIVLLKVVAEVVVRRGSFSGLGKIRGGRGRRAEGGEVEERVGGCGVLQGGAGKGDVCLLERLGRVPLVEVRACACVLL